MTTSGAVQSKPHVGDAVRIRKPGGDATTSWFRYSTAGPGTCNDNFGTRAPARRWYGTRQRNIERHLHAGDHRTRASNDVLLLRDCPELGRPGRRFGPVLHHPSAPTAATASATNLTTSSAQLNGSGNQTALQPPAGSATASPTPVRATTSSARAHRSPAAPLWATTSMTRRLRRAFQACRAAPRPLLLRHRPEQRGHGVWHRDVIYDIGHRVGHHQCSVGSDINHRDTQWSWRTQRRDGFGLVPLQHHQSWHLQ